MRRLQLHERFPRRFGVATLLALMLTAPLPQAAGAAGNGFEVLAHMNTTTGILPWGALALAPDGRLHGTAVESGARNNGTVFRISTSGKLTVQHAFTRKGPPGYAPYTGLILANDGNFYGVNSNGGALLAGTVFKMTPGGDITPVHAFDRDVESGDPTTALVQASDGDLYGTTYYAPNRTCCGTAFRLSLAGTFETLHVFDLEDGNYPGSLVEGPDGNLYGTTWAGGAHGAGTVFRLSRAGALTVLHDFGATPSDGAMAGAGLLLGADGNFYGVTASGGKKGNGTAFRMTPAGDLVVLHSFAGSPDGGSQPQSALIQARNGSFYGTTRAGGPEGNGTVFRMQADGKVTTLHEFAGFDGWQPSGSLVQADDDMLYGTTAKGGDADDGVVYRIKAK